MVLCGWPLEAVEFFRGQQAGNRDDRLGPWLTLLVRPDQHIAWPTREPAGIDFEVVTGGRFLTSLAHGPAGWRLACR
jgi:hypothetical protein